MDIVRQRQLREWTLLGLVGIMAVVANLPDSLLATAGLERGVIMAILGLVVLMAVFLYVRFFFFLLYTLLAIGANLPERWAEALHITQGPLLLALIAMVCISLLNYAIKFLPSGLEAPKRKQNPEATQMLLEAIERGNLSYIRSILRMGFDLDLAGESGFTPLMAAARRGDEVLVELLLASGADPSLGEPGGTAAELASAAGHAVLGERLKGLAVQCRSASDSGTPRDAVVIG